MNEHEPIRMLRELGAELGRVAAAEQARGQAGAGARLRALAPRPGTGKRIAALTAATVIALSGVAYAMPMTRDAVMGVAEMFDGWMAGDESQAPGRALRPGEAAPEWLDDASSRVIAEGHGVKIVVQRVETEEHGTMLGVSLNGHVRGGVSISGTLPGWRERFAERPVSILGTAPMVYQDVDDFIDDKGRVALVGLTARPVEQVELRYATGPPLSTRDADGGVILMADAWRDPREVVAFDADGAELGRESVSHIDLRHLCERVPSCAARLSPAQD
ncbi:MAG TPA: hypothetical protein VFQ14_01570 [Thermoleophilaceae bacterium]|nr:hypothetical protein [Thermoleophilaceae bacterium]